MNADDAGSNPAVPPILILDCGILGIQFRISRTEFEICYGAVTERLMQFPVEEDDDSSSPFGPATSTADFGF